MKRARTFSVRRTGEQFWGLGSKVSCPPHLRAPLENAINDRHYRDARFLTALGMIVAFASLIVDAISLPQHLATIALVRLVPVVPVQMAALMMPRRRLGWQKFFLGLSLVLFGCSLVYASALAPPPSDAFMALGVAFFLGIAVPLLPLRGRELALFVAAFIVPVALMTVFFHRDFIFTRAFLPILVLVGIGAAILSHRLQLLERRSALLMLQAEERARDLEQSNARLTELSMLDSLTNLANRRWAELVFERDYSASREEAPGITAVLLLDLDHFKQFNDRWGHELGDRCLQSVAEVLRHCAGSHGGLAARFGGEEFVVLLRVEDPAQAIELAEQVRVGVERIEIDNGAHAAPVSCTVSIGIALHEAAGKPVMGEMLRNADAALYRAKNEGRNRHRLAA